MKWIEGTPHLEGMYLVRNVGETYPVFAVMYDLFLIVVPATIYDPRMEFVGQVNQLQAGKPLEYVYLGARRW